MKTPFSSTRFVLALFVAIIQMNALPLHGQNWQPLAAGYLPPGFQVFSISAPDDKVVWATASELIYFPPVPANHRIRVLRSSDGGQTWVLHQVEEAQGTVSYQIVAVDSLTAWLTTQDLGSGPGKALYQTTDGGQTWTKKSQDPGFGVGLTRFPDGQHWLAHNRNSISRSSDNAVNWNSATITGYQTNEYQIIEAGSNMAGVAGDTLWNGTSAGRIIRFTNFGESHAFLSTGLGGNTLIKSIAFQDHLNGLLYSEKNDYTNHRISRSTDGGTSWSQLQNQPDPDGIWNITAVPGLPGFYVLCSHYLVLPQLSTPAKGKIALTTNSGDTWTIQEFNQPFNAITFTSPSTGWVGSGRILSAGQPALLKYTGSPLVGTGGDLAALTDFSVFPNPVTDKLRVKGNGKSPGPLRFQLTSVSGTPIVEGVSEGTAEIVIDMKGSPTGMYLLRVQDGAERWGVWKVMKW